jgi:hypothetical protein
MAVVLEKLSSIKDSLDKKPSSDAIDRKSLKRACNFCWAYLQLLQLAQASIKPLKITCNLDPATAPGFYILTTSSAPNSYHELPNPDLCVGFFVSYHVTPSHKPRNKLFV